MISVGQEIATVYNARFEAVFGTRGFNPLASPEQMGKGLKPPCLSRGWLFDTIIVYN
jgi:hypothetical protein